MVPNCLQKAKTVSKSLGWCACSELFFGASLIFVPFGANCGFLGPFATLRHFEPLEPFGTKFPPCWAQFKLDQFGALRRRKLELTPKGSKLLPRNKNCSQRPELVSKGPNCLLMDKNMDPKGPERLQNFKQRKWLQKAPNCVEKFGDLKNASEARVFTPASSSFPPHSCQSVGQTDDWRHPLLSLFRRDL